MRPNRDRPGSLVLALSGIYLLCFLASGFCPHSGWLSLIWGLDAGGIILLLCWCAWKDRTE